MTTRASAAEHNVLLNRVGPVGLDHLLPHLTEVDLHAKQVLHRAGEPIDRVWFLLDGVTSLVVDLDDGPSVEAASIGHEGMVGLSLYLGARAPTERASVQVSGRALTMPAARFAEQISVLDGPLESSLRRYAQDLFSQLARNTACNRIHTVRQRAARWLLMTADRVHGLRFDLTQEVLAQMLGVRRASVSDVAQTLADDGCITYTRGAVTVLDRDRLEANACGCYTALRR